MIFLTLNDIITNEDWNVVRNTELDKFGGSPFRKNRSVDNNSKLMSKFNLNDVWRKKPILV